MDCIFCQIVAGEIPCDRVDETDDVLVFRDIAPQAPTHLLVIPKQHVTSLAELEDEALGGKLLLAAAGNARREGLDQGWRLITNIGADGGQEVHPLHFHVVGGHALGRMLQR